MATAPAGMTCILKLDTDVPGWQIAMIKLFKFIHDVSYSIDAHAKQAHVSGRIDKLLLLKLLEAAKTNVHAHQINYGIDLPKPRTQPKMKCVLLVDADIPDWHITMCLLLKCMQGVTFDINTITKQVYVSGKLSPPLQLKLLAKAEARGAHLCWLYYGYDIDRHGTPVLDKQPKDNVSSSNSATPTSKSKSKSNFSFCSLM